jgi:serpin B
VTFQPSFLDTLATDYGAGVQQVDFAGNPNGAEQAINLWVSNETNGKVSQVLPMGAIDDTTVFVLVDAMYFQAGWQSAFHAFNTSAQAFTRGDGTSAQTPTMQQTSTFPYAQASGWQLVELPYAGGQEAMDIVLPAAGTDAAFDAGLTSAQFASMLGAMQPQLVQLALPRFQVAAPAFSIKTVLQGLGMNAAWTGAADFAPMTTTPVSLGDAFHQSFLSVDENGTQAAAATAIVGTDGGVAVGPPPQVVTMAVDRPFFLAIRDVPTGTVLFAGKIEDPAQAQ